MFWPERKVALYKKILLLGKSKQRIVVDELEEELRGTLRPELEDLSRVKILIPGRDDSYFTLKDERKLGSLLDEYLVQFKNGQLGSEARSPAEYYSYEHQLDVIRKLYFFRKGEFGFRLMIEACDLEYYEMFRRFNLVRTLETILAMELDKFLVVFDVRLNEIGWNFEIQALPKIDQDLDRKHVLLDVTVTDESIMLNNGCIHRFQRGRQPALFTKLLFRRAGEFVSYEEIAVHLGKIEEGQDCDGPLKQDIRDMAERLNEKVRHSIGRKLFEFNDGVKMTLPGS